MPRSLRRSMLLLLVFAGIPVALGRLEAQVSQTDQVRERIDLSRLGPQVGERVPDFSLKDQHGNTQTLQSIMGARGAMLVFQRSADW